MVFFIDKCVGFRLQNSMHYRRSTLGVAVIDQLIIAVGGFDGSTGLSSAEAFDPRNGFLNRF